MKAAERWRTITRIELCCAGTAFLIFENSPFSWLRIFLLTGVLLFILINTHLPDSLPPMSPMLFLLTLAPCILSLLLTHFSTGSGSSFLVICSLEGIQRHLRKTAALFSGLGVLLSQAFLLYSRSGYSASSLSQGLMFLAAGLFILLQLLAWKETETQQKKDREVLSTLQDSRRELRDANLLLSRQGGELEKMAVLRERNRMSKQIHDTVGHVLTALSVQLGAAERLSAAGSAEGLQKIANARQLAREGLESIRTALSQIDEDQRLFDDRIHIFLEKACEDMGIRILPLLQTQGRPLQEPIQRFLLDALREGITNGVRHGKATAFVFRLSREPDRILFHLEDNGIGSKNPRMGYGLTALRENAECLGGSFSLHTLPMEGYTIEITLPDQERRPKDDPDSTCR